MDGLSKSLVLWRNSSPGSKDSLSNYKTMTVMFTIQKTPTYGTYLDDASDMPYGKTTEAISAWQDFFGYKPCLFKNGQVVGYLNPNDYTKFENGTSADITSGNAGDVMIEFPRRGIKISRQINTVTVSMTDDPDNPDFTYYAHTKGSTKKDKFYIGAYLGYKVDNKLRSLSGKTLYDEFNFWTSIDYANKNNTDSITGYMLPSFYQFLFIQCMYLLEYKGHINSRVAHGCGAGSNYSDSYWYDTGTTNTKGLMNGDQNVVRNGERLKIFGIEDFWGNFRWFLSGFSYRPDYGICTAIDNFNDYTNYPATSYINKLNFTTGSMMDAFCSTDLGFIPLATVYENEDSYNNYFGCLSAMMIASSSKEILYPVVGGLNYYSVSGSETVTEYGIFLLNVDMIKIHPLTLGHVLHIYR